MECQNDCDALTNAWVGEVVKWRGKRQSCSRAAETVSPSSSTSRPSIEAAVAELRAKLSEAGNFFRGAAFRLDAGRRRLTEAERDAISATVQEFGIELREPRTRRRAHRALPAPAAGERALSPALRLTALGRGDEMPAEEPTLYLRRTLRSGQRVDYQGNVVIMGDVNAGRHGDVHG